MPKAEGKAKMKAEAASSSAFAVPPAFEVFVPFAHNEESVVSERDMI